MSLTNTPGANRLHIALFGRRNSGKSSLINTITGQDIALVSEIAGTTTDPVYKAMELHPIGPVMFIDTAGFDDVGTLGELRIEKTRKVIDKTDIAIVIFSETELSMEKEWMNELKKRKIPVIPIINKADILNNTDDIKKQVEETLGLMPIIISAKEKTGLDKVREELIRAVPEDFEVSSITAHLVNEGDFVLLVMPQDIQAPKGRLILPQVQVIRDLLDLKCIVMSVTTDKLENALKAMSGPPKLIITDSQVFDKVYAKKPEESLLTSFSVLFAEYKGDISAYIKGAEAIDALTENSAVLIAEACTHAPLSEDIGRVQLPRLLREKIGKGLTVDIVSGSDFPKDLSKYSLVIQCGCCMFNRKYVLSRIESAKAQNVRICNYGIAIAKLRGILEKVAL
ncbi:[FeFe] hydrogenase H-cluster maturation GTPase HydF [Ruminiclostridium cellulolyticum]|uniref:Small GTP-binding protein n=1 Tax=Ruminiclostridium cellulolyticum (strain ATCC 35319 / DSM 5812 / JCM 6584 / H10) TaxID=394503 RepID=B8I069_RUMCH|nr:[FeFe] hydrogenase H-cluster maturation GTPase HydF [Ruminiclostridium cellulolyticum]ACL77395.1 small GTP-binding protein [Ruminiclostridium cellulolyticum H10]